MVFSAPEQTTEKFLVSIEEISFFASEQKIFLSRFLREWYGIKFAGQSSSLRAAREALGNVRQFIHETREEGGRMIDWSRLEFSQPLLSLLLLFLPLRFLDWNAKAR